MKMVDEICMRCRFWFRLTETRSGICRRYPPVLDNVSEHGGVRDTVHCQSWSHPITTEADWCGEYRPEDTRVETRLREAGS